MIVVIMRNDDNINNGNIRNLTRRLCETFRTEKAQRGAPICHDRIEESPETGWKFDEITRMAKPGGAQVLRAGVESVAGEGWRRNRKLIHSCLVNDR